MILAAPPSQYEYQVPYEVKPQLILHFDMNKTLIASDREGQKTGHDTVCAILADQIFGLWDDSLEAPMNYFHYVKYHLLPNPKASKEVKLKQKEKVSQFLAFLQEISHPDYDQALKTYERAMAHLETQETQVFRSFYKLIDYLQEKGISYKLVIRTFGSEALEIAEELNERFGSDFIVGFHAIKQGDLQGTESSLYDLILSSDHHLVVRDDWEWWFSHGEHWEYGKPFPIDLGDSGRISLFFDDNARPDPHYPQKCIVAPYHVESGVPISPRKLIENDRIFPVEMLEALCDENYYIKLVEKVLPL